MSKKKLTDKQESFVQYYLTNGFNATQAAISAGYSKRTARQTGMENLKKPYIHDRLAEHQKERREKYDISSERVIQEYAKVAFANMGHFIEFDEEGNINFKTDLTENQLSIVSEFNIDNTLRQGVKIKQSIKFKLHDKLKALEALAKHLGVFNGAGLPDDNNSESTIINYFHVK